MTFDVPGAPEAAPRPSRATLRDVAHLAGVSIKTASRVLSGQPNVRDETARRVREAARTLRFRPNRLARDLRSGAVSTAVGFVIGDLSNPFYTQIAAGAERLLREHGLELFIATSDEDPERERRVTLTMLERRVRALFVVPVADEHAYLVPEQQLGTPMVFIDRPAVDVAADSIVLDNRRAVREATERLIALGHRRIGLLADRTGVWTASERVAGFADAMRAVGTADWQRWVHRAHDVGTARSVATELLAGPDAPTALFALNNRITAGVIDALAGAPDPPAILGFDDFEFAPTLGISVIAHDPVDLGRRAAETALDRLGGRTGMPQQIVLPTRFIPRGSGERPPREHGS
ncbi:LacI family DNA-binding transcriptional regulator [Luedemannella helvata]|uniref:LacI family DNA-binding transcriptional regulator n=1 Tax=Luedemannella helvata TaxID=349315 RepID=A0ABP4VZB4_9ACTN